MNHYLWWIPASIAYYVVYYWLSVKNHQDPAPIWYKSKWLWAMLLYGAVCPMWLIVCRISKNLTFDGLLYDIIMFLVFPISMFLLGQTVDFKTNQWVGLGIVVIGFFVMRFEKWW